MEPSVRPDADPAVKQAQETWMRLWEERRTAVLGALRSRPDEPAVTSFAWKDAALPGSCAMTFPPAQGRKNHLVLTLGLTQPGSADDRRPPWEFAVQVAEPSDWAPDLLYQLVTLWLKTEWQPEPGLRLPLLFLRDPLGRTWVGLTEDATDLERVGTLAAAYLWPLPGTPRIEISSGPFGFLSVVGVTPDEEAYATELSTAHLLLLLARRGVSPALDPFRMSVLSTDAGRAEAERLRRLSRSEAKAELDALPGWPA
ncbi:MAG TPA: hypothetical protein VEJ18_15670 [Planctomycetota bacterium]|nr:hypothetical protein [Planctomycetota bacterium]